MAEAGSVEIADASEAHRRACGGGVEGRATARAMWATGGYLQPTEALESQRHALRALSP